MKIKFYGYDKCDTCRKAAKFLKENEIDFTSFDITQEPPSPSEIKAAMRAHGMKRLFNTSGLVYREMKLGEKLSSLSESEALELLAKNGRLIKRPFVVAGNHYLVGFQEKEWKTELA